MVVGRPQFLLELFWEGSKDVWIDLQPENQEMKQS